MHLPHAFHERWKSACRRIPPSPPDDVDAEALGPIRVKAAVIAVAALGLAALWSSPAPAATGVQDVVFVGNFSITAAGDTTARAISTYRIEGGRQELLTVLTPGPELVPVRAQPGQ